jgi:hypothetical protein
METVLAFPRRDVFELLDLMPASTVVGMAAKSSKGLSLNLSEIEDRRSIALKHIPQSSLPVSTFFELDKWVTLWNPAVFNQASRRAPAASGEAPSEGGIQSAPVNTDLSSGEDLRQPHLTWPYRTTSLRLCNLVAPAAPGPQSAARVHPDRRRREYVPSVPIPFHADPTLGLAPIRPRGLGAGAPRNSGFPSPNGG